jgi:TRAP transporter 4TM/12TM fusion protein
MEKKKKLIDKVVEQEKLGRHRQLPPALTWVMAASCTIVLVSAILYNFHLSFFGLSFSGTGYLFFLMAFLVPIGFLVFPESKNAPRNRVPLYDFLLAAGTLGSSLFFFWFNMDIMTEGWEVSAPLTARILSLFLIVAVVESARRTGGLVFAAVCLFFACFPLFAHVMPYFLKGISFPFWRVVSYHGMGPESLIGIPLRVVGTTLIGFMVFAVALQYTGAGTFFINFALALFGHVRGGAAKVSIVSSALMGSISGSVISNVLTTGSFTIPAMKKTGYPPHYAGAVEACASTGGVLMPPIMGATAFVMAEFLQVPYVHVIAAALLPSILYYMCLFAQIDAFAAVNGLQGARREDLPSLKKTLKEGWFYLASLVVLIYLCVWMWRESQAPWIATVVLLALAMIRRETRITPKKLLEFIEGTGKFLGELASILAACGLIIGAMSVTGVAHSFAHEVVSFAGGNAFFLLVLGAITSLILGMGMTITACYIFLVIVMAPALIQIGFYPLAIHLFVMYWGMISFITPPVALGSFAAASLAEAPPMKTGFQAMRLGIAIYFLPFFFVYNPALVLHGSFLEIVKVLTTCTLGILLISAAMEGYLWFVGRTPLWARALLFCAGILLAVPEGFTDLLGLALAVVVAAVLLLMKKYGRLSAT